MTKETIEKHTFQAEVQQLLNIVINSLYTEKEIFIRELVSNASDALEKMRYLQLTEKNIFDEELNFEINISTDESTGTITIQDFGIGMTRQELQKNLGTIAHSGSKAFLKAIKEGEEVNKNLIGQFGVGFYSAFMVAKEIKVYTHSWKEDGEHLLWKSEGTGDYEIETTEGQRRGCKMVITLKDDAKEFSKKDQIERLLKHYSSFVNFPINLNGERINTIDALWTRTKNDIKEEEYKEFYKFQANAFDEPLTYLHFNVDSPLALNALIFVPTEDPERFGFGRAGPGVSLHCRKILIEANASNLLPDWLRFVKGVIDSADLPLNISRETMQDSALLQKINRAVTKRLLKHLESDAEKNPDTFDKFYKTFSNYLKEGIATDHTHRDQLAKLLRYESSLTEPGKKTSLADYISRAKEEQKEIYYLQAPDRETIEKGPYLEAFQSRNLEVLFLYETADEIAMDHLNEFEGKKLVAADSTDVNLEDLPQEENKGLSKEETDTLCSWLKESLGDRVEKVEASKRLVNSPAVALNPDRTSPQLQRMMQTIGQQNGKTTKAHLEINPRHQLIKNLFSIREKDADMSKLVAEQILDNALLAAGYLENPRNIVHRIYDLMEKVTR